MDLFGVGPAGAYLGAQTPTRQQEIREACAALLGPAPFTVRGEAWCAAARVAP